MWGIIIILAIVNLGLILWVGIITKELNTSTEGLSEIAINNLNRQSVWQEDLQKQEKRLLAIENGEQEKNDSLSWQIYENESYGFNIQHPNTWVSINSIFDPETIVEFTSKARNDNNGLIRFAVTPYDNFEEASEESIIINEGARLIDDDEVLINDSKGLKVYYKTSEGDIFTHYFFIMDKEVIEISLDNADLGYNKIFEDILLTLTIKQ